MSGGLLAAASGVAFGLSQVLNVRVVRQLDDPYLSTLLQLFAAAVVSLVLCALSGELALVGQLSAWAVSSFVVGGGIHFFLGWTLLNASQLRIGAARTAPPLATVPLWGIAIAAVVYGEVPRTVAWVGIVVIVAGALTVSSPAAMGGMRWQDSRFALATAFLWALSPIFTIEGLREVGSPLLGLTIGLVASALAYVAVVAASPERRRKALEMPRAGLPLKMLGGAIVAVATWWRFQALVLSPIAVVLALSLLVVPTVLVLAPLLASGRHEAQAPRVWFGAALVVGGSLVLIMAG